MIHSVASAQHSRLAASPAPLAQESAAHGHQSQRHRHIRRLNEEQQTSCPWRLLVMNNLKECDNHGKIDQQAGTTVHRADRVIVICFIRVRMRRAFRLAVNLKPAAVNNREPRCGGASYQANLCLVDLILRHFANPFLLLAAVEACPC
jgi:hypothetical protein